MPYTPFMVEITRESSTGIDQYRSQAYSVSSTDRIFSVFQYLHFVMNFFEFLLTLSKTYYYLNNLYLHNFRLIII